VASEAQAVAPLVAQRETYLRDRTISLIFVQF